MSNDTQDRRLGRLQTWIANLFDNPSDLSGDDSGAPHACDSGIERRRHPRVQAAGLQSCLLIGESYCDGRLADISLGGAQFRGSGKPPMEGAEVRVVSPAPLPREVHGRVLSVQTGWRDYTLHIEWLPTTCREAIGIMISQAQRNLTPSTMD